MVTYIIEDTLTLASLKPRVTDLSSFLKAEVARPDHLTLTDGNSN